MQPPTTVDSFQGQENDVVVVVMGTASPKPGPGFTSDSQRLNVMLTRQQCGLVIDWQSGTYLTFSYPLVSGILIRPA